MYNKVILVGNLTRNPELRYLPSGSTVCNTAIATSKKFKKQDGTSSEEVCFVDIAFFGRTAEVANQYLKKGSKILIEGRLKQDQWTDQNGTKRSKHSVNVESMQMLDTKGSQGGNTEGFTQNSYEQGHENSSQGGNVRNPYEQRQVSTQKEQSIPEINVDDEEIPF